MIIQRNTNTPSQKYSNSSRSLNLGKVTGGKKCCKTHSKIRINNHVFQLHFLIASLPLFVVANQAGRRCGPNSSLLHGALEARSRAFLSSPRLPLTLSESFTSRAFLVVRGCKILSLVQISFFAPLFGSPEGATCAGTTSDPLHAGRCSQHALSSRQFAAG